jgi:ATP-dependent DNA helicase DinG
VSLQSLVSEVFAPDSVLARAVEEFRPRAGQTQMALAVARTIEHGGALVVEAGTGVGKTFSYLVPALLSGQRVLLSTATKTLQDQLFNRDLPRLIGLLGLPVRTALLKGRSSYLCLHRMGQARHDPSLSDAATSRALARIEIWSQQTRSGDLAELPGLDERSAVIPWVTSSRDNCLASQCPQFRECHVNLARREALGADLVVINHHLFFADMAVRESGMAELLPTVRTVIFDEAHQLNETGVQFLGRQLSTGQVLDFVRDTLACGLQQARGLVDWSQCCGALEKAARELRLCAGKLPVGAKLRWSGETPERLEPAAWSQALAGLRQAISQVMDDLATVSELSPDFVRLHERVQSLLGLIDFFHRPCEAGSVRWLEAGFQLRLVESPLDIAQAVQTRLLGGGEATGRSWIFTSATLGDDAALSWFTQPCGLTQAEILSVDSPFDYAQQAAVYVPPDLPRPADPLHSERVGALVAGLAAQIGGRTLVLTTSLRALRTITLALQQNLPADSGLQVLTQGQMPKRELVERLRCGAEPGQAGCILVASASFWEGVDIPGDALQMVVIDKLPFPPPNDPLVEARTRRLELAGRSPFNDYFVPEAAVALKQGAGRLIRRETDHGLLVICDIRLQSMGYGRRLLAALPPMRRIRSEQELAQVLQALAPVGVKAVSWPVNPG